MNMNEMNDKLEDSNDKWNEGELKNVKEEV